jgi:hypothetical protein
MAGHLSGRRSGARIGALVGAVGGLVFVLVNAGATDGPWPLVLRGVAVVAFLATVVLVLRAPALGSGTEPSAEQMRRYWLTVLAEVVAIPVGNLVLRNVFDLADAGLPWVAVVLGVHFVVFARIFPGAGFLLLGVVVTLCGVVGLVLVVADADRDVVTVVSGVVTGFALLASVLRGVLLGRAPAR